ncbi:hypothetical protein MMC24_003724 [Lignoscripta atroalba]|nr:hypothetical protein [Lignoscripta atroalba]
MTAPSVHITYPPASLLEFPPASLPTALFPPKSDHTLARPFDIDPELYNNLLSVNYPLTIALIYATTVTILNRFNKQRENKPWAMSRSRAFYAFVIVHNVFLAIYSFWTFAGMIHAIRHAWPGWQGEYGLTGVVDSLCKIHGPRGLGSAATYNSTTSTWGITNEAIKLVGGNPDSTDLGRIWNEGLAFYGWLFYVSKFYEVVDTLIVLAKGKNSSFLQTYHHAGAMLCMWAGIRYMSPPIWMFVLINSGIHGLMYTYYALSALAIPVPPVVKRTITSLQIAQFVFGATYAVAHLFIAYSVPVSTPYLFTHNISQALPAVTSSVSSAFTSATASAGVGSWLKKIALRAAAQEGLAENVKNKQGEMFGLDALKAEEVEKARDEIRHRLEYPTVRCIDTSGQAFAILLNVLYLAPLTWLFVEFFFRAYVHRTSSSTTHPTHTAAVEKASRDAVRGVEREIHEAMASEQGNDSTEIPESIKAKFEEMKREAERYGVKLRGTFEKAEVKGKEGVEKAKPKAKEAFEKAKVKGEEGYEDLKPKAKEAVEQAKVKGKDGYENVKPKAKEAAEQVRVKGKEGYENVKPKVENASENAKAKGEEAYDNAKPKAEEAWEQTKAQGKEGYDKAKPKAEDAWEQAKAQGREGYDNAKPKAEEAAEKTKAMGREGAEKAKAKGTEATEKAKDEAEKAKEKGDKAATNAQDSQATRPRNSEPSKEEKPDETPAAAERSSSANEDAKDDEKDEGMDESAYEVKFDDLESPEEKKAEAEFQPRPNGS